MRALRKTFDLRQKDACDGPYVLRVVSRQTRLLLCRFKRAERLDAGQSSALALPVGANDSFGFRGTWREVERRGCLALPAAVAQSLRGFESVLRSG
jgi:hypothetical protein